MALVRYNLNDLLRPGKPLPSNTMMVEKGLEILEASPHGQQLVNFVEKKAIRIELIATPRPATYLPHEGLVYVGFNRNNPVSPAYFVLMMVKSLREAQQEAAGIVNPGIESPEAEHFKIGMEKYEDVVWFMCTVAYELEKQEAFTEYRFLDELGKMGYNESIQLYKQQVEGRADNA